MEKTIDASLLRDLAGDAAFARGLGYATDGLVRIDSDHGDHMEATARGTRDYRVGLRWQGGQLSGTCDCPVGLRGDFCKHQVAAALLWADALDRSMAPDVASAATRPTTRKGGRASAESAQAVVQRWLSGLEVDALSTLVVEFAGRDRDAWRELVARARFASAPPDALRKAVSELIGRKRFLDYQASLAYATRLETLVGSLAQLIGRDPAVALDLVSHALHRLLPIYAQSDDSAGAIGEVMHDLGRLHLKAALAALPAPVAFAKAWLKLRMADDWSFIPGADAYARALTADGLALIERQASTRLDALPARARGMHWDEHSGERLTLWSILEQVARQGGDLDALLARRAQALDNPWDWLELARLCAEHGRTRLAVQWLERGLKAHPDDGRLLEALAANKIDEGFAEEAVELYWRVFELYPEENQYLQLRHAAQAAGNWDIWRGRALAHAGAVPATYSESSSDRLICLHLAENDVDAAWRIANDAQLSVETCLRLARALEANHPEGALRAYRTVVNATVELTNNQAYRDAIAWLGRMRPLHQRLGTDDAFGAYLESLRETYRAKRNFVKMLADFMATAA